MQKQPRINTGINMGMFLGYNNVKLQQFVVSMNETLEAKVSLHGLVISSDKIHALIPST